MRELTARLKSIMSVVFNQLELLPASEGAVEEMHKTLSQPDIRCAWPWKR
jgi:hypothetical protein